MQLWRSIRVLALALGLAVAAPVGGWAADQNELSEVLRLYHSGRVLDAIAKLDGIVARPMPAADRAYWIAVILQVCAETEDLDCLVRHGSVFMQMLRDEKIDDTQLKMRANYTFVLERIMAGDFKSIEDGFAGDFPRQAGTPTIDRELYIDMQILAARMQREQRNYKEAQTSIAHALAILFQSSPDEGWFVAKTISRLVHWLAQTGDVPKAWAWMHMADPFISATLPPNGPEFAEWLVTKADLISRGPIGPLLVEAVTRAAESVERLQIDSGMKLDRGSRFVAHRAALQILMGDPAAAKATLATHPIAQSREIIIEAGSFRSWPEFLYAVAEIFVTASSGERPDERWLPAFDRDPEWAQRPEFLVQVQAFRHFARAILLAHTDTDASRQELREAVQLRIGQLAADLGETWDAFPIPSDVDRVTLQLLLPYLGKQAAHDRESADLLLQATELLNRNLRSRLSEAVSIVAAEPDEETRRLAHSALWLAAQQADWEERALQEFLAAMSQPGGAAAAKDAADGDRRFDLALQLSEYIHLRRAIDDALARKGVHGLVRGRLPKMQEVQAALRPGELLLTYVPALGSYLRICIRKDLVFVNETAVDADGLANDVRTLSNALTATYGPSDTLDRQYPVEAAIRLHDVLFGGLSECVSAGSHVIMAPTADLVGLPAAALLAAPPPREGDGYDLSKAHWLAYDFAFSYVHSAQDFLAARQAAAKAGGDLPFLGVGNPKLGNSEGSQAAQSAEAGPVDAEFRESLLSLGELPETQAELERSKSFLGGEGSSLLSGADATEERFRLLQLSRYNVVHFATHSLVREELPGLAEAALVLTPGETGGQLNDGLITADELASLDLRARLVVLSACNTANLELRRFGAGLQGLTDSLAVSGVPSVVASLWPVESDTSRLLMGRFFRNLTGLPRRTVADAFAAAQRETIEAARSKAFLHPRFWAAFLVLGDGDVMVGETGSPMEPPVLATVASGVPDSGENLSGAASADLDSYFVSQSAPEERGGSILARLGADGKLRWKVEDRGLAAGPIAAGPGSELVGGYRLDDPAAAVVRGFSSEGDLLWQRVFDRRAEFGRVGAVATLEHGAAVAIADESLRQSDGGARSVRLVGLDDLGNTQAEIDIPYARSTFRSGIPPAAMAYDGKVLLVAVNTGRTLNLAISGYDDFYLPTICWEHGSVRLSVHDPRTLVELRHRTIDDFAITTIASDASGFLVGGSRLDPCKDRQSAFVGRMTADLAPEILWQDDGPFDSRAACIARSGNGYRVAGTLWRTIAVDEGSPVKQLTAIANQAIGFDARAESVERAEAFLVDLALDGTVRRTYFDAGSSTTFHGLLPGRGQTVAFGSVGSSPLWLLVGE